MIEIKSKVVVILCDLKSYVKLKVNNPKEEMKTLEDLRRGYPEWTSLKSIKSGRALSWDDLDDMC